MEELKNRLRELLTAVCGPCTSETEVALQEAAMKMNAFYGTLYQMVMEYAHAKEYLDTGRRMDVEETQKEYGQTIENMESQVKKCMAGLEACPEADWKLKTTVSGYLSAIWQELEALMALGRNEPDENNIRAYQNQLGLLCESCGKSGKILALSQSMEELALLPYGTYNRQTELAVGAFGMKMQFLYRLLRQMKDAYADRKHREYSGLRLMEMELRQCLEVLKQCGQEEAAVRALCGYIEELAGRMDVFAQECSLMPEEDYKKNLDYLYQACEDYIRLHIGDQSYLG